jgi:hypothetical protein
LALLPILLLGCAPKTAPPDPAAACCAECSAGASQDPQGRDLSLLDCGQYATTVACQDHFSAHPTFVQDCR